LRWSVIDTLLRYYDDNTIAGDDDFADYCGFIAYSSRYDGDCTNPGYNDPTLPDYFRISSFGEHYCPTCRCMTVDYGDETGYAITFSFVYVD